MSINIAYNPILLLIVTMINKFSLNSLHPSIFSYLIFFSFYLTIFFFSFFFFFLLFLEHYFLVLHFLPTSSTLSPFLNYSNFISTLLFLFPIKNIISDISTTSIRTPIIGHTAANLPVRWMCGWVNR